MNFAIPGSIGVLAILILVSGYCSAARAALTNVRRQNLRSQAESGDRRAQLALDVAEDSSKVLSTFHLANLITNFLIAGMAALLFVPLLAEVASGVWSAGAVVNTLAYFIVILLAGLLVYALAELLPAVIAAQNLEWWSTRLAGVARLTVLVFTPLVALMQMFRQGVASLLGSDEVVSAVTEEEIMTLVDAGEEEGSIEIDEREMIYSVFQLDETLAREIMVPRIDVVAVEIDTPLSEALEIVLKAGHSRIPVYENSLDQIKGLLYAKDILETCHKNDQSRPLNTLLRPAIFVPETKNILDLLRELQHEQVHLSIVIDEYGGTAGLVTIEDIVEEIVGEIFDEYDEAEEALYEIVNTNEIICDGRIDLDDFNRLMHVNLTDDMGETLGGYIYSQLGRVPDAGDLINTDDLEIEVLNVEDRRIRKVRVKRIEAEEVKTDVNTGKTNGVNGNGR